MNSSQLTEIITRCKSNDRKAQYQLYEMYSKAMYNVSYRIMNDHVMAEDVLQMAFVKVFKNLNTYKADATIGAWIKRIVINTALSEVNKRKMEFIEIDDKDFVDNTEDESPSDGMNIDLIRDALMSLSDGYRAVFSMYAIEGYDHQEIAEVMGISVGTSKSQYSRAKVKIKEILKGNRRISNIS